MLKILSSLVAILSIAADATAAQPNTLTAKEQAGGWVLLFDGKTLDGWKPSSDANWQVKDGIISVSHGKAGLFCTTKQYDNYELSVDFRCPANTNSGVFLRTPLEPKNTTDECYELNIAPTDNPFPTGGFVKRQKAEGTNPKADDWNTFEVMADGPNFVVQLNGEKVLEYKDPQPKSTGFIGLQFNQGPCEFRNIKLRPLTAKR